MARNVQLIKNFGRPKEPGSYARLMTLTGENKGDTYYLKGKRILIGRGDTADIKLMDGKVSREHAEIVNVDDAFHWKHEHSVCVNDHVVPFWGILLKLHKGAKCIQNLFFFFVGQRFAEKPKKDHQIAFVVKRFALDLFACDADLKR